MSRQSSGSSSQPSWPGTTPNSQTTPYLDRARQLTNRYPILSYLNDFVQRPTYYEVRCSVLEFHETSVPQRHDFVAEGGISGLERLRRHLSSHTATPQCRLFLLEDLDCAWIEFLGAYLNIDATVFASQIRDTHYSGGFYRGDQPPLPSCQDANRNFTLKYYEARYFDNPDLPQFSNSIRTVGNLSRKIAFGKGASCSYRGHIGLIRRKASFWSRAEGDKGWNGLFVPLVYENLLSDEPGRNLAFRS